jgi:hypothetical protein
MFLSSLHRGLKKSSSPQSSKTRRRPGCGLQLELLETRLTPSVDIFTNKDGAHNSNWSDPLNWSLGRVPQSNDVVRFTSVSGNPNDDLPSLTAITLQIEPNWNAAMTIAGALALGGNSFWSSGEVDVKGINGSLTNNGTLTINGTSAVSLGGTNSMLNNGTMALKGPGGASTAGNLNSAIEIDNSATGSIFFLGDTSLSIGSLSLTNAGTIKKTTGIGISTLMVPLVNNGGTIDAESGTIELNNSTDTNGIFRAGTSSSEIDLTGGDTFTEKGTFKGSGTGELALDNSGTFAVDNSTVSMNVASTVRFESNNGIFSVPLKSTLIYNGTLNVAPASFASEMNGAGTFVLNGVMDQTGGLDLACTLRVPAKSTYDIQGDLGMPSSSGQIFNVGTIEKTTGSGVATLSPKLYNNGGTIDSESGTIQLTDCVDTNGTFKAGTSTSILDLTGGNVFTEAATFTGTGNGTIELNGGTLAAYSRGATFNVFSTLLFDWTNGTISVPQNQTLTFNGTLTQTSTNSGQTDELTGGGTLNFPQNASLVETGPAGLGLAGITTTLNISAGAVLDFLDSTIVNGTGQIVNAGTIEKTRGIGTSTMAAALNNTGTVQVDVGIISVTGAIAQCSSGTLGAGAWVVAGSSSAHATLQLNQPVTTIGVNASVTLNGPGSSLANLSKMTTNDGSFSLLGGQSFKTSGAFVNTGTVTLSPGSVLTVNGNFTQLAGATLNIQMGGSDSSPTIGSIATSNGGKVTLNGALNVTSTVIPAVGSALLLLANSSKAADNGIFSGLAEGATFNVTVGSTTMVFAISYLAGTNGNDIEIARQS